MNDTYRVFINGKFNGVVKEKGEAIKQYAKDTFPDHAKWEIDGEEKILHITVSVWNLMEWVMESKTVTDVKAWQVCECDAVAAYTAEEALEWYKNNIEDKDLCDLEDVEEVNLETEVWADETRSTKVTLLDEIYAGWIGNPFVVMSQID